MISGISLVVPVYNEKEIIEESLGVFKKSLSGMTDNFEIIVVDDGSNDGTAEVLSRFCSEEKIKIIHNQQNLGSGMALWRGFQEARYELVMSNFSDRPFDLDELPRILRIFARENPDFVVVARKNRSANPIFRKITSLSNFLLVRMLFGIKVKDFQFVQVYKKYVLDKIRVISRHTFVAPEIIIKAVSLGYKYCEYSTDFYPRKKGRSKYSNPWLIFLSAWEIITFFWQWQVLKRI